MRQSRPARSSGNERPGNVDHGLTAPLPRLAQAHGFPFGYASGYWLTASTHGLPDAGIATYTQMLERVETLVRTVPGMAIIADADTGYGGLINMRHTMLGYARAGVAAMQIEDQEFPKRCGHSKGKRVVSTGEMVARIKVAVEARGSTDGPLIIARSDARAMEGMDAMLRRLEAYAAAGADILFPEALTTEDEIAFVAPRLPGPAMMNMADGGHTPILSAATLQAMGYAGAIFPAMTALAAAAADNALRLLRQSGTSRNPGVELYSFADMCSLLGFGEIYEQDARWAELTKD
ncbi:oxaloacetate decarboxylase [Sandarakinorhabdus limnophila]|uniref:oxaloacetate decarboxylase n=1 Tax=Sandarakinorhabdus limnophila TaxID=210512 RepID=UPI0034C6A67C